MNFNAVYLVKQVMGKQEFDDWIKLGIEESPMPTYFSGPRGKRIGSGRRKGTPNKKKEDIMPFETAEAVEAREARNIKIIESHNDGLKPSLIAKKFNIHPSTVSNILTQNGVMRDAQSRAPGPRKQPKNISKAKSEAPSLPPAPTTPPLNLNRSIKQLLNETINNLILLRDQLIG